MGLLGGRSAPVDPPRHRPAACIRPGPADSDRARRLNGIRSTLYPAISGNDGTMLSWIVAGAARHPSLITWLRSLPDPRPSCQIPSRAARSRAELPGPRPSCQIRLQLEMKCASGLYRCSRAPSALAPYLQQCQLFF